MVEHKFSYLRDCTEDKVDIFLHLVIDNDEYKVRIRRVRHIILNANGIFKNSENKQEDIKEFYRSFAYIIYYCNCKYY